MHQYNLYEAKIKLSQLVQGAPDSEELLIVRAGKMATPCIRRVRPTCGGWMGKKH